MPKKLFLAKWLLIKLTILYGLCILDSSFLYWPLLCGGYLISIAYCPFFHITFYITTCTFILFLCCTDVDIPIIVHACKLWVLYYLYYYLYYYIHFCFTLHRCGHSYHSTCLQAVGSVPVIDGEDTYVCYLCSHTKRGQTQSSRFHRSLSNSMHAEKISKQEKAKEVCYLCWSLAFGNTASCIMHPDILLY